VVGATVIDIPVSPPVQVAVPPAQAEAVKTVLLPAQIVALFLVTVGVEGLDKTVIVVAKDESLLQAFTVQRAL
jgi:hypothetical protein